MSSINSTMRKIFIAAFLLLMIWGLVQWIQQRMAHVYTDDARIAADMIDITSKVAGWVVEFPAETGLQVVKGDVLAVLDSREIVLTLQELKARESALKAGYEGQQAEIQMVKLQTDGALQAAQSQLEAARAAGLSAQSELEYRQAEWKRSQSLRNKGIISVQDFEATQTLYRKAVQSREAAHAIVSQTGAMLVEAQAAQSKLAVMERNLLKLKFERESLQAEFARERIDLVDKRLLAPAVGIVDKLFVDNGEYVLPGMRLLLMHDPEQIWVSANVKETEVRHLKVGQSVDISVDAYPGLGFEGRILKIGNAATSQFSLLPSTNPSGNFTKVTQRINVKISLQQRELLLKPGMMVEVAIDVR